MLYEVPSRTTVGNKLLDELYAREDARARATVLADVRRDGVTIASDAMTSSASKRCLVNVVAHTRHGVLLLDVSDTRHESKTTDYVITYLLDVCTRELGECGSLF